MTTAARIIILLKNRLLNVNKKWQVELKNGYRWFPNQFSQDIEVLGKETNSNGIKTQFIRIKTEVLTDVELAPRNMDIIDDLLCTSTMCGPIYEDGKLSLCTNIIVNDSTASWIPFLIKEASILQIAEATFTIPYMANVMGAKVPYKEHPTSGPRLLTDHLVEQHLHMVKEIGEKPSQWEQEEFNQILNEHRGYSPAAKPIQNGNGLIALFPYGYFTSICNLISNRNHPRIGSGLLIEQKFPIENIPLHEGIKLSLKLNKKELNRAPQGYGFGSYHYSNGLLHHSSFIPNHAYSPELLINIYTSCAKRAKLKGEELTGDN